MDETLRRYLGWMIAVLMIVMAAGSFLARYAGFIRLLDRVEAVSLTDSVVKTGEGPAPLYPLLALPEGMDSRMPLRATREGLVRECGGADLIGVLMLADAGASSDVRTPEDAGTASDVQILEDAGTASDVQILEDAGTASDAQILDDAVASSDARIFVDGVPADRIDIGSIRTEQRYRIVYEVDEAGIVVASTYESLP